MKNARTMRAKARKMRANARTMRAKQPIIIVKYTNL